MSRAPLRRRPARRARAGLPALALAAGFAAVLAGALGRAQDPAPGDGSPATPDAAAPTVPGAGARPNVLLVYMDDLAAQAVGAYGAPFGATPHLDGLAREGLLFRNAFCTNSICAPARAVVLTGNHSHVNGVLDNGQRFDTAQPTFPAALRAAGYQTALFGKWHLKAEPTGFDRWEVLPGQGRYHQPVLRTPDGERVRPGHATAVVTDLALDWLREERDPERPFLLMVQHKAPHRNWQPGPDEVGLFDGVELPEPPTLFDDGATRNPGFARNRMSIARDLRPVYDLKLEPPPGMTPEQLAHWNAAYEPRNAAFRAAELEGDDLVRWKFQRYLKDYLRCVVGIDRSVGRLLAALDELELADDTLVLVTSDQGFFLGEHGFYDKRWMYEESLRFPLVARWPGRVAPGTEDAHLVQNLDLAPTLLALAGVPDAFPTQGVSLLPLLAGQDPEDWRGSIYYRYYETPSEHVVPAHFGVRTQTHKLVRYPDLDAWELFDLERDPRELHSLHDDPDSAELLAELQVELGRLRARYGDAD